jgi:hypothetical protein
MCNPPKEWAAMTPHEQVSWQQPDFCFSFNQLQTALYMKISLSDFMTVAAARTRLPFFSRIPGKELAICAAGATITSTIISAYWTDLELPDLEPLNFSFLGQIWIYCTVCFVIQDIAKLVMYWLVENHIFPREDGEKKPDRSAIDLPASFFTDAGFES